MSVFNVTGPAFPFDSAPKKSKPKPAMPDAQIIQCSKLVITDANGVARIEIGCDGSGHAFIVINKGNGKGATAVTVDKEGHVSGCTAFNNQPGPVSQDGEECVNLAQFANDNPLLWEPDDTVTLTPAALQAEFASAIAANGKNGGVN